MAEGILVGEVLAGKSFVYDHYVSRRCHIVFGKEAPAKQWQPERLKIALAAHFNPCLPKFGVRLAGNDRVAGLVLQRRWIVRHFRNGEHARESAHPLEEL